MRTCKKCGKIIKKDHRGVIEVQSEDSTKSNSFYHNECYSIREEV